jgi:hypothetical protein
VPFDDDEAPVALPEAVVEGVAAVAGAGVVAGALSVESCFGAEVDPGDSPAGGFNLSE